MLVSQFDDGPTRTKVGIKNRMFSRIIRVLKAPKSSVHVV